MYDREARRGVANDTIAHLNQNRDRYGVIRARKINTSKSLPIPDLRMRIRFVNLDTLDAVTKFQTEDGETYAFLDMASSNPYAFGGGYLNGAVAQEEDLCRRTSLPLAFELVSPPIPRTGGIFVRNVHLIRQNERNAYQMIPFEQQIVSNCLMACAIRKPIVMPNGQMSAADTELTRTKIRSMLQILVNEKQTHVVLGAFGCGAYGNPPEQVAQIFRDFLFGEFRTAFREVVFAIIDGKWTRNLEIFQNVLANR